MGITVRIFQRKDAKTYQEYSWIHSSTSENHDLTSQKSNSLGLFILRREIFDSSNNSLRFWKP